MNLDKKQARKSSNSRLKKRIQMFRQDLLNKRRFKRLRAFRLEFADKATIEAFANRNLDGVIPGNCWFCEMPIKKTDVETGRFLILVSRPNRKEYVFHHNHFFQDDLTTPLTGAVESLRIVRERILDREFGKTPI